MNTLETLTASLVGLKSAENETLFRFVSSQTPRLERVALNQSRASILTLENLWSLRQEKEKAQGEETLLFDLLEAALLRLLETARTVPFHDEIFHELATPGIELPEKKGNFWQAVSTLRELEPGQARQQIGALMDRQASRSMDLCARLLEGRLDLCEEQGWKDAQHRFRVLWACPGHLPDAEVTSLSAQTADSYKELLLYFSQKLVGESPAALTAVDLPRILNHPAFDSIFSQGEMVMAPERYLRRMTLDPKARGRVVPFACGPRLPWGEAVTLPLDVPAKILLLYRPHSGIQPFESYLREIGGALYWSALETGEPAAWRWFGDPILTNAYSSLWTLCLLDRTWLHRVLKASPVRDILVYTTFRILYRLRFWTGIIRFEAWLYPNGSPGRAYREWSEILRESCQVQAGPSSYLQGICEAPSARVLLEGICLAAQLKNHLRDNFNEDWFVNPRAGNFLRDLWHQGPRLNADRLWSLTGGPSSWLEPLRRLLEENLK